MRSCPCCVDRSGSRGSFRPVSLLFQIALLYAALVAAGGTLINTGHPVAVEAGELIQAATFVDPAIAWADARGFQAVAGGLRVLAGGIPI